MCQATCYSSKSWTFRLLYLNPFFSPYHIDGARWPRPRITTTLGFSISSIRRCQRLAKFDAFPELPSTCKTCTESRGFMTIFVVLLAFLLVLNDIGEYIWGWPDSESSVDDNKLSFLDINVDLVVNMPCKCKSCSHWWYRVYLYVDTSTVVSVDLRDAMGDRLYLSGGLRRDGVGNSASDIHIGCWHDFQPEFDIGQATVLKWVLFFESPTV